ncbi:hypothetical protein [Ectopseudomonas oleovorans]|uniref:hypothetical protein n=1 Tax=Ectopseudomonas oleovorans TaxID=301 RepID=UPI000F7AE892|nr:hypothetical protein [Pseudomonas oleovorans]
MDKAAPKSILRTKTAGTADQTGAEEDPMKRKKPLKLSAAKLRQINRQAHAASQVFYRKARERLIEEAMAELERLQAVDERFR